MRMKTWQTLNRAFIIKATEGENEEEENKQVGDLRAISWDRWETLFMSYSKLSHSASH